jgi:hypothetical protein
VIGAIVGGVSTGSAKGASAAMDKDGVGTMASAATHGPVLTIPAESQMDFQLASRLVSRR